MISVTPMHVPSSHFFLCLFEYVITLSIHRQFPLSHLYSRAFCSRLYSILCVDLPSVGVMLGHIV